jgi:hypothetical protein
MWKKAGGRKAASDDAQDAMASRLQLDMGKRGQGTKASEWLITVQRTTPCRARRASTTARWLFFAVSTSVTGWVSSCKSVSVSSTRWFYLTRIQYTFRLTRRDEYELAEEVLLHIIHSNAYQDVEAQDIIRLTLMGTGRSLSASA